MLSCIAHSLFLSGSVKDYFLNIMLAVIEDNLKGLFLEGGCQRISCCVQDFQEVLICHV